MISIIMPTYNQGRTILRAVRSVLAQTAQEWELIIVNDGSESEYIYIDKTEYFWNLISSGTVYLQSRPLLFGKTLDEWKVMQ